MLQTIREHTQGWIAGVIIGIIILTFALWGIHSYFIGGGPSNVVAEVNGTEITKEQLTLAYERLKKQFQLQYGQSNTADLADANLRNRALQGLIDVEALKQSSYQEGFQVSDRQVDNYLQNVQEFKVDGQFSMERFQEILSSAYLSTSEFLDLLRTSLLIEQPKQGIIFSSFALPEETMQTIALVNQERNIDYALIPFQAFLSQTAISPAEINAYYNQHQKEFMNPEQAVVDYVELSLKEIEKQITLVSDDVLQSFYDENKFSFSEPRQWKLLDFTIDIPANATQAEETAAKLKAEQEAEALRKGADFSTIAKKYHVGLNNQNWLNLNSLPEDLKKPVSQATQVGEILEPIKTTTGYTIVKVVDVKEPGIPAFSVAKEKVKAAYVRTKAEEKFASLRETLADVTYEHPDTLENAAQTLKLPIKTSEVFSKETGGKDISQAKKVRMAAFSNDVLNLQNNSDVIQVNPETLVVIHIKKHTPETLMPLSVVTKQIEERLRLKKAQESTYQLAESILKKLQAKEDLTALFTQYKLNWVKAGFIGRYENTIDTAILDMAFRLPQPAASKNSVFPSYGIAQVPQGYALIALQAVKPGTADPKQYPVFSEQVQNSEGMLEYELYKETQLSKAKISIS